MLGHADHNRSGRSQAAPGYSLTTAEITYHMPDHPHLLQTFVWQDYDLAPGFPCLQRFLAFWEQNLDSPLHSVRLGAVSLMETRSWRHVEGVLRMQ